MKLKCISVITALIFSVFSCYPAVNAEKSDDTSAVISSFDFDNNRNDEWMGFGSCFVSLENGFADSGSSCLKITNRESAWNGPLYVANEIAEVGKTISFYSKVYHAQEAPVDFKATLKITNQSGEEQYREIASDTVQPKQWSALTGSFTLDYDAASVFVYIETSTDLCDFYIDTIRFIDGNISDNYSPSESDNTVSEEVDISELKTIFYDDFEHDSTGIWAPSADSTLYLIKDPSSSDNTCLAICNKRSTYDSPMINITDLTIPKEKYYFKGKILNRSDSSEKYTWTARIQNSNGVTNFLQFASVSVKSNSWEQISGSLKIPEDVIDVEIYFDTTSSISEYCIDDIEIKGTQVKKTKEITMKKNGLTFDFEKDMDKWKSRGDIRIFRTDTESHSGKYSLFVSKRNDVWNGAMYSADFLLREKSYSFDAFVKYSGSEYESEHTFVMKLQYQFQGKTEYAPVAEEVVKKDKWTHLTGNFTLPESAQNVSLYLHTIDAGNPTANDLMPFYIDDVSINETSNARSNENSRKASSIFLIFIPIVIIAYIAIRHIRKRKKAV